MSAASISSFYRGIVALDTIFVEAAGRGGSEAVLRILDQEAAVALEHGRRVEFGAQVLELTSGQPSEVSSAATNWLAGNPQFVVA